MSAESVEPFDDRTPIYQQIADRLRTAILSGALEEGDQVMSTTQYATTHRINPATAAKAMSTLVEEGLLHKRRGLGMFVSPGARQRLQEQRRATFWDETLAPVLAEARALGITPDQLVTYIQEQQ
ncbi:GntR family transcriptional regulator [Ornithinimicrobium humiphilum]|uniref:DNA-binding transcriptional regulator YhcF (GntR family) n=1 Tax=Ornithinimicrobium humiphilum TaxID=125288 RepID=A0A543KLG4_9MICO|nr:GntR family transcriptional regulator [Ornithinimicrobium humiphilum]TQM95932.1 DNA-binding transcriptional regulator YhcF (GntR family) [Ornithinimicrobium humiphilum]